MDTSTIIIALISIAVMSLPFVLSVYNQKKVEKQFIQHARTLAKEFNNTIDRYDVFLNGIIALDENAQILYFVHKENGEQRTTRIPLTEHNKCEVAVTELKSNAKNTVIETVGIKFPPKTTAQGTVEIKLYDGRTGLTLSNELQLAKNWTGLLNELITSLKK
jgi:hypothetical protein